MFHKINIPLNESTAEHDAVAAILAGENTDENIPARIKELKELKRAGYQYEDLLVQPLSSTNIDIKIMEKKHE